MQTSSSLLLNANSVVLLFVDTVIYIGISFVLANAINLNTSFSSISLLNGFRNVVFL